MIVVFQMLLYSKEKNENQKLWCSTENHIITFISF